MDEKNNKAHWESWAGEFKNNLRATTKGRTIKEIEVFNIISAIEAYSSKDDCRVLECGCGNGINLIEVAKHFPHFDCKGFDFVQAMVDNALVNKKETEEKLGKKLNLTFQTGDLRAPEAVGKDFDVIFTNRAIINLSSQNEQNEAVKKLAKMLAPGGILILLENGVRSYATQNSLRKALDLPERTAAAFNVFVNEDEIISAVETQGLKLQSLKSVGSLHDIILYALLPKATGNADCYDHPLVELAKNLEISSPEHWQKDRFGTFGQVNMFVFKR